MWEDPIVTEVRRIRERLAERFDFDTGKIFADMRENQTKLGPRLVRRKKTDRPSQTPEPDTGLRSGR